MDILKRDPRKAYLSNTLALPKTDVAELQLHGALTYDLGPTKEPFRAWTVDRDHYLVPRNYILTSSLAQLPFPVVDARLRVFPRITYRSKVTLDFKNPDQSYQRDGVAALLAVNDGILCLRCGGGKSVCAIDAVQRLHTPGLILVNDAGLAEQWTEEILEFTDLKREDIGFVGNGEFIWQKKLCIGLVQTLASRIQKGTLPRGMVEHFGVVVPDECHTTAGPAYFNLAITPFHGRRWGLSATPRREDSFDSLLRYTIGRVVYSYLMPEMRPLIYFRRLPTTINMADKAVRKAINDCSGEEHVIKLYGYLATREDRTSTIIKEIKVALKQGRHILVLSQSRAMVERLGEAFPDAGVVHGGIANRKERLRRIRQQNPVIIMSRLGKQGLNKPILDTLMILDPNTKHGIIQQLIGRVQRPHVDKQQPMVVLYEDYKVDTIRGMWMKVRKLLNAWPDDQGGRLRWQNIGDGG
jgi:superfamily II DNA or RNA helicase